METNELEALYRRHVKTVWNVCITLLRRPADAEDAVQETFVRLLRSNPEFESEEHEKAWLIRTAQNVCKNDLARARRRDVPLENAADAAHSAPEIDETLAALRTLPKGQRAVVVLRFLNDLSVEATAEALGNLSAAGRDMRISPAVASNRIKELEKEVRELRRANAILRSASACL